MRQENFHSWLGRFEPAVSELQKQKWFRKSAETWCSLPVSYCSALLLCQNHFRTCCPWKMLAWATSPRLTPLILLAHPHFTNQLKLSTGCSCEALKDEFNSRRQSDGGLLGTWRVSEVQWDQTRIRVKMFCELCVHCQPSPDDPTAEEQISSPASNCAFNSDSKKHWKTKDGIKRCSEEREHPGHVWSREDTRRF